MEWHVSRYGLQLLSIPVFLGAAGLLVAFGPGDDRLIATGTLLLCIGVIVDGMVLNPPTENDGA